MEVKSYSDTLQLFSPSTILRLSHGFIIPESVQITYSGDFFHLDTIDWIHGNLILAPGDYSQNKKFIIKYDYLPTGVPLQAGPKWKFLPYLDLDENIATNVHDPIFSMNNSDSDLSTVYSSGSIYRQLNMSPLGGSDFSGGLNIQLNGDLGENLQISGILSDTDLPLHPEGTTRELEAFDQIYLSITHPNYSADAGDIIYDYEYSNFYRINRKLVGLKNNFQINQWDGSAVYAGSKGTLHSQKMKGRDGDQGPYRLNGKDGNKDIIVLSGTEKVWVDGKELIRGYNHDYTIDYSLAEIFFTANILINFDTDIYIEFQYSDFNFSKGLSGGTLEKTLNQHGKISMGLFQEKDQFNQSGWSKEVHDSLVVATSGHIKIDTRQINEQGEYVFRDSIYVYDPDHLISEGDRYQTIFSYDVNGSYVRQISPLGRVYYEYIPIGLRSSIMDLYSPYKQLNAPKNHRYGFIGANYQLGEHLSLDGVISGSGLDQNTLSVLDNAGQNGIAHQFSIQADSVLVGPVILQLNASDWFRNNPYQSLGQENNIRQQTYWHENTIHERGIRETDLQMGILIPGLGTTLLERAFLKTGKKNLISTHLKQDIHYLKFKNSTLNLLEIHKPLGIFKHIYSRFNYHSNNYTPFLVYQHEYNPMKSRYNEYGGGLTFSSENRNLEAGMQVRTNDVKEDTLLKYWRRESEDVVGFFNYKTINKKGWVQDIIYKRRVKSFVQNKSSFDYSLARIHMAYHQVASPFRWDFTLKKEESYTEQRAVVYDSIGTGLGQFRYEPEFNAYISDRNGAYIAYTVQTGQRHPTTAMESVHRLAYDFGKINGLPDISVRSDTRIDFRGSNFLIEPHLSDSTVARAKLISRIELDYYGLNRSLSWLEIQRSFNGLDPRGNDLETSWEAGANINRHLTRSVALQFKSRYRSKNIRSTISSMRSRTAAGWWQEMHLLLVGNKSVDMDFVIVGGEDKGQQREESYFAQALGIAFDGRIFIRKTGRIQAKIERTNVTANRETSYVPPEALNGHPLGIGIRSNIRLEYFINRTISTTLSMNTIRDSRYKKIATLLGEVRAHF
tara:strand:+ start:4376 stop:7576 length:3201 start_codon:yes stop_codon:yes gene_type:complete